jgi:hypothetical protein
LVPSNSATVACTAGSLPPVRLAGKLVIILLAMKRPASTALRTK